MAVNSDGIPLFAGIEEVDDMFIATMQEMDKDVADEISIPYPLWQYLDDNDLIEYVDDIGNYVPVYLMDKENTTVQDFTAYDDADNTPQELLSEAKFAYGHASGVQMYNREELTKNSGRTQLIDLMNRKQQQLEKSLKNHIGKRFMDDQDSDGRRPMGLGRILAVNQTCGTIDPTQQGFAYWNPQQMLKSGGGGYSLATEFRAGINRLQLLCSYEHGSPNVFVCGEDVYAEWQAFAETKLRLTLEDIKEKKGWSKFEMFPIYQSVVIFDKALPAKAVWALNFDESVKVRIHRGTNFVFTPWIELPEKVATKKRNCLLYWSIYCKHRNANGTGLFT